MPQNYNHDNWQGLNITTSFNSFFRHWWIFKQRPYYFGQRVWLRVTIKKLKDKTPDPNHLVICERTGSGDIHTFGNLEDKGLSWQRLIKGSQLSDRGDYKIYFSYATTKRTIELPLMTADVINPDRRDRDLWRIFLSAILAAIFGGLVGYYLAITFGIGV